MQITQVRNSYPQSVYSKSQSIQEQSPRVAQEQLSAPVLSEEPAAILNGEEKNYFEQAFPESLQEVKSYLSYDRSGVKVAMQLGAVIDRKG